MTAWDNIIGVLEELRTSLDTAHVPKILGCKVMQALFIVMQMRWMNSLMLRSECCSSANAKRFKDRLKQLEEWAMSHGSGYARDSWNELKQPRQVISE